MGIGKEPGKRDNKISEFCLKTAVMRPNSLYTDFEKMDLKKTLERWACQINEKVSGGDV